MQIAYTACIPREKNVFINAHTVLEKICVRTYIATE